MLTTPDGKEKKCIIHHIKLITPVDVFTNSFDQFQDSIKKNAFGTAQHQYNLRSKVKLMEFPFRSSIVHNSFGKQSSSILQCMYILIITLNDFYSSSNAVVKST